MLAMQSMASNGQHNLPFGYDQNEIRGLGLPPYLDQSLPGRPLLNEQESSNMNYFFTNMAAEGQMQPPQQLINHHFHSNLSQLNPLEMPNTYVGSETYLQPQQQPQQQQQQAMDWNSQNMGSYHYSPHPNSMSTHQSPTSPFTNGHGQGHMLSQASSMFSPPIPQGVQPLGDSWQQSYRPQNQPVSRTDMHFGSDPHFLHTGYAAPEGGGIEVDLTSMNYAIQPTSSGSNTQPNSHPGSNSNTQPSSPVTMKKRKLNAFQHDALRMTSVDSGSRHSQHNPAISSNSRKSRKSSVKTENVPVVSLPKSRNMDSEEAIAPDEDAEYDEEASADRDPSPPAPWPASKARPTHKPSQAPKPAKSRKKSSSVALNRQAQPRRQSSTATNTVSRVPLTAEQKKANHTNSEQRRRDATSKAYADLYDLAPEIEEGGKQSTMKKLHSVVSKVESVSVRLRYVRELLGADLSSGVDPAAQHDYSNGVSHMNPWQ